MRYNLTFLLTLLSLTSCDGQSFFRGTAAGEKGGTEELIPEDSHVEFFISSTASGSDDGLTAETPWTIGQAQAELESVTPDSGDYAFKRGDVWEFKDSIVIDTNPSVGTITLTAYGTGPLPNIRGGIDVTAATWVEQSTNFWYTLTSAHGTVEAVHLDGAQAILASHPNATNVGLEIGGTSSSTNVQLLLYDAEDDVDASGGFIAISDNRWTAEYIGITSAVNNVITMDTGIGNITVGGWVKLYDFKEGLDMQGEWWATTDTVFVYSTTNPGTTAYNEIIISVNDKFAFHIKDADDVTLELLHLSHFNIAGVQVTGGANDNLIQNNVIEDVRMWGVYATSEGAFPGVLRLQVLNNNINNTNTGGIKAKSNVDQSTFNGNTIDSIGPYYGYGNFEHSGNNYQHGIQYGHANIDDAHALNNIITHTGGAGINHDGQNAWFFDNIFDNNVRNLSDMGSMYTYGGTDGSTNENVNVSRARITNTGWDGILNWFTGEDSQNLRAMYFDGWSENCRFDSSFIGNSPELTTGIQIPQGSTNIDLRYDTVNITDQASHRVQGIHVGNKSTDVTSLSTWTNMWIIATGDDASCIGVNDSQNQLMVNWTWDTSINNNNYDGITSGDFLYRYNGSTVETFGDWKTDTGQDAGSSFN